MTETDDTDTALAELLGAAGRVKVLEAFLGSPDAKLSAKEIAQMVDVSESTVGRNLDRFRAAGVVTLAERVGRTSRYRLNQDSELAELLARTRFELRDVISELEPGEWAAATRGEWTGGDDRELADGRHR